MWVWEKNLLLFNDFVVVHCLFIILFFLTKRKNNNKKKPSARWLKNDKIFTKYKEINR